MSAPDSSGHVLPGRPLVLKLLGGGQLFWEGQPLRLSAPRLLGIVAYLHLNGPASRDELMEVFWSGRSTQHLRQALYQLRALPGSKAWLTDAPGQLLSVTADSDVSRVREWLAREEYAPALDALEHSGELLGQLPAVSLVFSDWLEGERESLGKERLSGLRQHAQRLLSQGKHQAGRLSLQRAIELDPLDEVTYRHLMSLEMAAGQFSQALRVFDQCRSALAGELGVAPEDATLKLLRQIEEVGNGPASPGAARALRLSAGQLSELMTEPLYGRESELATLETLLHEKKRVLLHGLGGIGKTRLAWAAAHEAARQGGSVLWLELGSDTLQDALVALLTVLELPLSSDPAISWATLHQGLTRQAPELLVLDNALSTYTLALLLDRLPSSLPVLVTARQRLPGLTRLEVTRLSRVAALLLLREHLPVGSLLPVTSLDALCAVLGDHPYALRLAASTLGRGQLNPQALLHSLLKRGLPSEEGVTLPGVQELIEQSVLQLDTGSYEAYLGMGSLYAPQVTPELLSLALRRPLQMVEEALYTLVEHGLVSRETHPGSEQVVFRMHELTWAQARSHRLLLCQGTLHAVCALTETHQDNAELLHAELPNLLGAGQYAREHGQYDALSRLMRGWLGGQYLVARGFPTGQLGLLEDALRAAEGRQDWEGASLLGGKLGDIWHALLGHHQAAIASYLNAAEQAGRAGLLQRQATLLALAGVLQAMNHLPQSQATLERAASIAGRTGDVLCQGRVLEQRGIACALGGDFAGSREQLQEARSLLRPHLKLENLTASGNDKALCAAYIGATSNLGQAEQRLGNLEAALHLKQEALQLAERWDDQLLMARAHAGVGEILGLMQRVPEAISALRTALDLLGRLGATAQEEVVRRQLNTLYTAQPEIHPTLSTPGGS